MTSFLNLVAKAYVTHDSNILDKCCFVFPNKRSGTFFRQSMAEEMSGKAYIEPEITTISDFVASFSNGMEASRFEQLFILYHEYRRILTENGSDELFDFDQFQFWGDMLLNDFSDVDRYLVDPRQIFVNVQRFKEIKSNYLTDEQREIISQYWGEDKLQDSTDDFWAHFKHGKLQDAAGPTGQFIRLWEVLLDLYNAFRARLAENGMFYNGMAYRQAVDRLKTMRREELGFKRIIFVGFNVLSTSEIKIFELLKAKDVGDYYWDYNSPVFAKGNNRSSLFLKEYVKQFKSRHRLDESPIEDFPNINIIGVPSDVAQTQEASRILSHLIANKAIKDVDNAINTAIVLPNESLFIPLLHAVPPEITCINVTMGYPLKLSPIASLVSSIVSLQIRSRFVKGDLMYFHEDIENVLTHPLIQAIAGFKAQLLVDEIQQNRLFNIPSSELIARMPSLEPVFRSVRDAKDTSEVFDYMSGLLRFLYDTISKGEITDSSKNLDKGFIARYMQSLDDFQCAVRKFGITMREKTFFQILERAIGSETVNFVGEPLHGLQVMGVLETRALNFENVILLSMNERIFPRKHYSRSLIPNALRKGYGMATIDFQECIYAYYFYRLIARAKNVYLIYDSRTSGTTSGEASRYIQQLKYLYNQDKIKRQSKFFLVRPSGDSHVLVHKTPDIMEKLMAFCRENSGKYLSASYINKYIDCPLQFYIEKVLGVKVPDDDTDYMDSSTYGTIVHEVAQHIYESLKGDSSEVVITKEILQRLQSDKLNLQREITRSVNDHFNHLGKGNYTPLHGEGRIYGMIMVDLISAMLKEEEKFAPFAFISGEQEITHRWKITDDLTINFRQFIDRIDRLQPQNAMSRLRIVDYKTGEDKNEAASIDQLFDSTKSDRKKAILQLFIYCNVLAEARHLDEPIQPILYLLKKLMAEGLNPVKIGTRNNKEVLDDYRKYNDRFMDKFRGVITEMFNPNIPFVQAANPDHACKFCKFKPICNKME